MKNFTDFAQNANRRQTECNEACFNCRGAKEEKPEGVSDSRVFKHLYLRGNHQQNMFHDKVDKINVWNRLWLSAKDTGVGILSAVILDSHLHLTVLLENEKLDADFMHHFRLSITQYYNRRYGVRGMLGTRKFGRGILQNDEDLMDCVCYHIRNVLHHRISNNYMDYPFNTARYVFGLVSKKQRGYYSRETLPDALSCAYLPYRERLPEGWTVTSEGMIVPPQGVFRSDVVEALFNGSRENYLETLTHRTTREAEDSDEPCTKRESLASVQTLDEKVVEFVKKKSQIPLPTMAFTKKIEVIAIVRKEFPKIGYRTLARIFGIPASTICYYTKKLNTRE